MKFIYSFTICFLISCGNKLPDITTNKIEETSFSESSANILFFEKRMLYKKPKHFKVYDESDSFMNTPALRRIVSGLDNPLISSDEQVLISIPVYDIYTPDFETEIRRIFPTNEPSLVDNQHIPQLKSSLKYLGKETAENWKKHVTYYPETEAKEHFKADTVIRFHIPLREKDFYKDKFKYVDGLYIQKKGYGYAQIYIFYTDKAKKNLNKYWRKVEGILRYEE